MVGHGKKQLKSEGLVTKCNKDIWQLYLSTDIQKRDKC